MGRSIQRRKERDAVWESRWDRSLAKPRGPAGPDLAAIRAEVLAGLEARSVRPVGGYEPPLRTKDPGRLALAVARHAYARYPVPAHLERIWLGGERLQPAEVARRKAWYLCVAQGGSLHREHTGAFLNRKETHRFLAPPAGMGFTEALWYAVARGHSDDHGACRRVAGSKVARGLPTPFWKDAARFFVQNPAPINVVNDLVDYLEHRLAGNPAFSLKGRTLESLKVGAEEWHRDLARRAKVAGGSWKGFDVPGYERLVPGERPHQDVTWTVRQILTGDELAEEGSRQRHCVASYKPRCVAGTCAIWSLRRRDWEGEHRALTMEMNRAGDVVQVRGYANRLATQQEMRHVNAWANENGFHVRQG